GVVVAETHKPTFATKNILSLVEETPLPQELVTLAEWLGSYYGAPASNVWQTILPRGLEKKRRDSKKEHAGNTRTAPDFILNNDQRHAVDNILHSEQTTTLLQGVTGSGKTAVYIEVAKKILHQD